ncbi:ESPR-type extended signal peptide-containing protein, partial [Escherichia coli]
MKRHLNTSYRLVWNHITGTLVVASELARSRGKRAGVAVALSLAAVMSVPALAADIVVRPGETVNGGTLANHDNQIVFGTTNGMTISTGLEYGPDNEANTGGQWVQDGGTANKTTVTSGGLQRVNPGGSVSDTVISAGGGQSLQGRAVNTTLNGGEQWMHEGAIATGTVINDKGWQVVKPGTVATDTVVNTGPEQTEYRLRFFANILCLCRRRLNTGHIPFMAGLRFVGLCHHKQHLLMSALQDVSPEILIHRQGTVIGFNQPQY